MEVPQGILLVRSNSASPSSRDRSARREVFARRDSVLFASLARQRNGSRRDRKEAVMLKFVKKTLEVEYDVAWVGSTFVACPARMRACKLIYIYVICRV
jgi:hypothetical protein